MKKLMLIASVLLLASCVNNTTEEIKTDSTVTATPVVPVETKDSTCADSCKKAEVIAPTTTNTVTTTPNTVK